MVNYKEFEKFKVNHKNYYTCLGGGNIHKMTIVAPRGYMFQMCDCCSDCGLCCDVFCCLYCTYGRMYAANEGLQDHMDFGRCGTIAAAACIPIMVTWTIGTFFIKGFPLFIGCEAWVIWPFIGKIKDSWGIPRNHPCFECFWEAFCCGCCTLIRINREMRARGLNPGSTCCQPSNLNYQFTTGARDSGVKASVTIAVSPEQIQPGYPGQPQPVYSHVVQPGYVIQHVSKDTVSGPQVVVGQPIAQYHHQPSAPPLPQQPVIQQPVMPDGPYCNR